VALIRFNNTTVTINPGGFSGEANRAVQRAEAAAELAGQYANADNDADIPDAAPGERGAKYWADQAAAQVPAVSAEGAVQVAAVQAEGATQITAVGDAASAVTATASLYVDALSTGEYDIEYESVGTTTQANLSSNVGVHQVGLINGTHVFTGDVIKALRWHWACASTTTSVEIKVWKRDVSGATGAGTINNAAPIATHDTLIATYTTTPTEIGITPGTSTPATTSILVLATAFTIEAGFDYMFQFRNLDAGSAVVNCGFSYFATAAGTQRRAGFQALTATPTTFTSLTTTRTPAITLLKARQKATLPATDATLRNLIDCRDRETLSAMNQRNVSNLYTNAVMFPNTLSVTASFVGDSLTFDDIGASNLPGAGYKATDVADSVTSGTVNNYGINGETSTQITTRVSALSAGDKAGLVQAMMGTNDLNTAGAPATVAANFATCASAITNANYLFASGYHTGIAPNAITARRAFDMRRSTLATYGAKALDMQAMWARYGAGASDFLAARRGAVPTDLTQDNLHQNKPGGLVKGYAWAAALVARNGGAPFVHDDMFGFKSGDASGAAIGTVRTLGDAFNYRILAGNEDGAVQINRTTGAITRTDQTIVQPYRECFVEAENNKGIGRNGRIILVQQMDGTQPTRGVRVQGNGASFLNVPSTYAPTDGTELTIVLCLRLQNRASGHIVTNGGQAFVDQQGWAVRFTGRNSAGTSLGSVTVTAQSPSDWNLYSFTIKTDGTICAAVVNEGTATTATPTASAVVAASAITGFFTNSGDTLPFAGDIKMLWLANSYLDITNSTVRANFYDSATKVPKDLGSAGTVSGVTPLFFLRGRAGDYLLGKNYGSVGDLHAPVPIGRAHLGYTDLDS